jgi:nucleotide-binding universal stress UspA family protein
MDFKKILVAVDASENSLRAVAYVGEMVGKAQGFTVQLLYIERFPERDLFPNDAAWKECCSMQEREARSVLEDSKEILLAKGLQEENVTINYVMSCKSPLTGRISARCSLGTSIAREILEVVKEGGFGTVALGRRGVSKAEEFLFGSVSNKVIHSAKGCTVWVVA